MIGYRIDVCIAHENHFGCLMTTIHQCSGVTEISNRKQVWRGCLVGFWYFGVSNRWRNLFPRRELVRGGEGVAKMTVLNAIELSPGFEIQLNEIMKIFDSLVGTLKIESQGWNRMKAKDRNWVIGHSGCVGRCRHHHAMSENHPADWVTHNRRCAELATLMTTEPWQGRQR